MDRLGAMEIFVLVVETGSFSAAARRLNLGQPAVSKIVAQLEARLGVRLLLRSTRRLTPTEAGEAYYISAQRALEDIKEAEAQVQASGLGLSGRLRISAPVTFARVHIIPHLDRLLAAHPQLEIDIVLNDRNVDLIAEGIDVALRLGDLDDSGLVARKLSRCQMKVLATPDYFRTMGKPGTPQEILHHQVVVYSLRQGGGQRWLFRRAEEQVQLTTRGRLTVSAAEGLRAAILAGLGLAITSEWMFAPELARGEVVTVLDDWQLPALDLWAIYPSGRLMSAKARAFVDFVAALPSLAGSRSEWASDKASQTTIHSQEE
ncbi:LysR family transcriptional regulator [Aeromonas molluscorum]|uniref:LysR family transcriptional regulator n=1 Tax=Aeromonas molluscorum TaxID=271417 RepID=UPI003F1963DA